MKHKNKSIIFFLAFLFIGSSNLFSGTISFDQLATSSDLTIAVYNNNLDKIFREFNTNTESSNIAADTLDETDFADNSNPRIRTAEGAACEFVYTGLLPTTTAGTLTGSIPAGTAYPLGYRIRKDSATPKTFTGDCSPSATGCWTFEDLDINGNFIYPEVAIDAATPAVSTNSIRISRVSTDGTQIAAVSDLRVTTCTTGSFSNITSTSGATTNLDEILKVGRNRISADTGWVHGLGISWDGLTTTFTVKQGSAYINGLYRANSTDVSVPQTADAPTAGTSGLDTGAIAASTRYTIYAVADRDAVDTMSFSFSASPVSPTGVTSYRKLGQIVTDANSVFTSRDMMAYHILSPKETIGGWIHFDMDDAVGLVGNDTWNVSSLTDRGVGLWTVTWDNDFGNISYAAVCTASDTDAGILICQNGYGAEGFTQGAVLIDVYNEANSAQDANSVSVIAVGDQKK